MKSSDYLECLARLALLSRLLDLGTPHLFLELALLHATEVLEGE
jgi:hypothetical protein